MLNDSCLYYVGGVVRDEILNVSSFDTDFCYEGNAIKFAEENGLNVIKTNPDFGTVRVIYENKEIDIASTRTETYPRKGHLPKVGNIGCSLKEDLIRRDFTVNAMAKRTTDGEFVDYFGGLEDIKNKKLRVLHDKSFEDDPTRIIRGLKFSVRFGFKLSDETMDLQNKYLSNINYDMSYHRIRKELFETFNLNKPEVFDKFIEQGIYKLLGKNVAAPKINGADIYNAIKDVQTGHVWLLYLIPFVETGFDFDIIFPRKSEKRIVEWVKRLKTQKPVNNTPYESVVIRRVLDNA